ncbi:MAG: secretin and TonB N-terminal domain-containing protein [Candidatus Omnitrophica bacterium]|nr:secretin and TonB N-terminal domain-containing protein [Candidatus Omnitrophota bacterium]
MKPTPLLLLLVLSVLLFSAGPLTTQGEEALQVVQAISVEPPPIAAEPGSLSLDFKEAEIQTVLQALARKGKINIVTAADIQGIVSIHLEGVSWEQALDTIVRTYGLAYEKEDNVIVVTTLEELKTRREAVKELVEIEPVTTKVIQLRYLDAADVKNFLEPQLTAQGKISVLEITGQKGWEFGGAEAGSSTSGSETRERREREAARSKAIVITDTPTTIDRLEKILTKIDTLPQQILIETRVMEVSRDLLRDFGLDIGTGTTGVESATALPTVFSAAKQNSESAAPISIAETGAQVLATAVTPSNFGPKASIGGAGTGINAGLEFLFRKLNEPQFEVIVRALEEDLRTNTLSAPHVLTLSGQEARILIGEKYPIIERTVSGGDSPQTTESLSYYQDIGIELFVVPSVGGDEHIDLIVHPIISTRGSTIGTNAYPIINIREAETQVVMEHGETIVIGGLLKDIKSKSRIGLPFLGKLPLIGFLFSRETVDTEKIDLLIFITAKIVEPGSLSPEETERLQRRYEEFLRNKMSVRKGSSPKPH